MCSDFLKEKPNNMQIFVEERPFIILKLPTLKS